MKIAVVAPSSVPFTLGGAERLWNGLVRVLNEATPHDAELIKLPTREHNLPDLMRSYEAFARLDVSHFDLVVSTKYPAWMAPHHNHVVYLQHTLRGLYDTYPAHLPSQPSHDDPLVSRLDVLLDLPRGRAWTDEVFARFRELVEERGADDVALAFPGPLARRLVHALDRGALDPSAVRRHLAISETVARRPGYFPPGVRVRAVRHPSDLEGLHCASFDYFFTASRIDAPKRLDLLVEAMRHVPGSIPLKIAGTGPDVERIQQLAATDPRVELLGYVDTAELIQLYANARAVPFVPLQEDLGLITLEAMCSSKPVITARDSGGPTELVVDGVNGFVADPTAEAIGHALARLAGGTERAERMGRAARSTADSVTWEGVVAAILGGDRPPRANAPARRGRDRRIVVASTFPVFPREGGGQLRCFHLYKALTTSYDVEVVSLSMAGEEWREVELAEGFVETIVPKSAEHQERESAMERDARVPITDIAASTLITYTPAYLDALRRATSAADATILAHPFQQPALALVAPGLPVIYDAHNAEIMLKTAILPASASGRRLLDIVRQVEAASVEAATLVTVCSTEDRAALIEYYGLDPAKSLLVPNGVDARAIPFVDADTRAVIRERWLARYAELSGLTDLRSIAIFTGSWHPPNIDAAKHVLEIAPELPDVLFLLIGRHCVEFDQWTIPRNVALLGIVSDATKGTLLSCADVALNPMVRGSGTNLKLVEYFAAGIPVVSTALGARGLGVDNGTHLDIAALDGFPTAIRRLLDHPDEAAKMAARSRHIVEDAYDWEVLGRHLLAQVERLVPQRRSLLYAAGR